ncbi:MAG: oxidoreductase-like domain-containing protein [Pontibacterium sp.]
MSTGDHQKPQPPANGECCEGGCNPCVWDFYYEEMDEWKAKQEAIKNGNSKAEE